MNTTTTETPAPRGRLPRDVHEAARVDGARPVQRFLRITSPLEQAATHPASSRPEGCS